MRGGAPRSPFHAHMHAQRRLHPTQSTDAMPWQDDARMCTAIDEDGADDDDADDDDVDDVSQVMSAKGCQPSDLSQVIPNKSF